MVEVTATVLADAEWVEAQLALAARTFAHSDRRVVATLWWYGTSWVLAGPPMAELVLNGQSSGGALESLRLRLTTDGRIEQAYAVPTSAAPGTTTIEDLGRTLAVSLTKIIGTLTALAPVRPRPLWALATDSLANQALGFAGSPADVQRATELAVQVAAAVGSPLPAPRFEDVPTGRPPGTRRFVLRSSCCLLYRTPSGPLCASCPKVSTDERRTTLTRLANGG